MFWCLPTALNKQRRLDIACNQNTIFEQLFPVLKHTISYKLLMKSIYLWGTCEAEFAKWHGPGQGMSHRPNQNKPWKYSHFPFYPNAVSPGAIKLIWYISTFLNLFSYLFQLTVGQILLRPVAVLIIGFGKAKCCFPIQSSRFLFSVIFVSMSAKGPNMNPSLQLSTNIRVPKSSL